MYSLFKVFKAPSTDSTKTFYSGLVSGQASRGLWGMEKRFDPLKSSGASNINRHFVANVKPYVGRDDYVLDLGCGAGMFLVRMAQICGRIVGADIAKPFVDVAGAAIDKLKLGNARVVDIDGERLPFVDAEFDRVLMVDVIHHLENIEQTLAEAHRVLKPGGKLLIFEPNKLNPLLFIMSVFDRNEWGLLPLGSRAAYEKVLAARFKIEHFQFCGLLIGPDSRLALALADFLLAPPFGVILKFFSPKLFIVASRI